MKIRVRKAFASEINWINEQYSHAGFVSSNFDKEFISIAEVDGEKVGLGRLIHINNKALELSGIYVLESYRNRGIAREIVAFLMKNLGEQKHVYCLPFSHLENFYCQFGFVKMQPSQEVPEEIINKYHWCKKQYTQSVSLLTLIKNKEY